MYVSKQLKKIAKSIFFKVIRKIDKKFFVGDNNIPAKKRSFYQDSEIIACDGIAFELSSKNNIEECRRTINIRKTKCYYSSDYRALYDLSGRKIISCASAIRWADVPSQIEINKNAAVINEVLTYAGDIEMSHYGHFLIEGLAHIWVALTKAPIGKFLYLGEKPSIKHYFFRKKHNFVGFCISQIGISRDDFVFLEKDSILESLYIPDPSFVIDQYVHEKHKDIFKKIYFKIFKDKKPQRAGTIYLSRRRFKQKSRAIINEEELEAHLIKHGVQIVYPETLDLYNQVLLFNTRSQIIACFGSAIHTALFSFNPGLRMFVLVAENTNLKTAKLIDSLTKTKTFYIPALKNIKTLDRPDFLNDKTIDIANVVYQLYKHNVI
jgi:hypothetical protein